jgi:hypothetical protein
MVAILLAGLALTDLAFAIVLVATARARGGLALSAEGVALGAVTNFFDTLGIGIALLLAAADVHQVPAYRSTPLGRRRGGALSRRRHAARGGDGRAPVTLPAGV